MSYFVGFLAFAAGVVICMIANAISEGRDQKKRDAARIIRGINARLDGQDAFAMRFYDIIPRLNAIEKKLRIKR